MIWRWLSAMLFLAGFGLLALAGYSWFWPAPGFSLEFAQPDLELPGYMAGEKRDVVFRFHNHSGTPMRVLGLSGGCGLNSCCGPDSDADVPKELPPGDSELTFPLEVRKAGEFRSELSLWVDDHGTREVVLTVHGVAKDAQAKEKGTQTP